MQRGGRGTRRVGNGREKDGKPVEERSGGGWGWKSWRLGTGNWELGTGKERAKWLLAPDSQAGCEGSGVRKKREPKLPLGGDAAPLPPASGGSMKQGNLVEWQQRPLWQLPNHILSYSVRSCPVVSYRCVALPSDAAVSCNFVVVVVIFACARLMLAGRRDAAAVGWWGARRPAIRTRH
jgi:hypothetical protein